mgnify:CR=1 FL=1
MAINHLSTANTFEEWLTTTASLVAVANNLTDNTNGGFVANSSIYIQGSAASLNVRTLANINTLQASPTLVAAGLSHSVFVGQYANTNYLYAVGGDTQGQLGDGNTVTSTFNQNQSVVQTPKNTYKYINFYKKILYYIVL